MDTLEDGLRDMRLIVAGAAIGAVTHADSVAGVIAALVAYPMAYLAMAAVCRLIAASKGEVR